MKRAFAIVAAAVLLLALQSCRNRTDGEASGRITALLEESARSTGNQRFEPAMASALEALTLARETGDRRGETQALSGIVGIDIMTSRDEDAWQKALEAEALARENGFREELAGILISKAKLCSYAEVSPETGRNDEGLAYAAEALAVAEEIDAQEVQAEACYVIASLYINKNRWNDPIDPELYRTAGEYLDRGQALAETYDIPRLRRNGILFRSRWFQQGDRNEEAIQYFTQVLQGLKGSDHLTAASLCDRLVRLYTRTGEAAKALDAHDRYVYETGQYIALRSDEVLQEMESRFELQEKEYRLRLRGYQLAVLIAAILLLAATLVLILGRLRRQRRRNAELQKINDSKEEIIALLSKDLKNPANEHASLLEKLSTEADSLSGEQIRERCKEIARDARSMNDDVANYVSDILLERSRRIADLGLSQRELQIIRLSAEGLSAAQIAETVSLSVHTVNTHRQRIYAKMGVRSVSEMLHKASRLGII